MAIASMLETLRNAVDIGYGVGVDLFSVKVMPANRVDAVCGGQGVELGSSLVACAVLR